MDNYDKIKSDEPIKSIAGYAPSKEESVLVHSLEKKFLESVKARSHKPGRWRRNEELYSGRLLAPFNLPKYKSRIEVPTPFSIVETIYSILTDRRPVVDIMPKEESQLESVNISREAIANEFETSKAWRCLNSMKRDGLIYGNGFMKVMLGDDGKLKFVNTSVYSVFFDPLATNIQNAKCVTFAIPTYLDEIKEKYENGKYVQSEGKLDEYRSFIHRAKTDGTVGQVTTSPGHTGTDSLGNTISDLRTDYVEKSPIEEKSGQDFGGGQALLKESWYYHEGTLCVATWCGKVLLQKTESPYPFIPLIMFKNYGDDHSVWGKGEPEIIEPLSVGTAIAMSQAVDNLIMHGNPAYIMPKSLAKNQRNRPTDKPGQIFWTNNPSERIDRLPAGDISRSTLPLIEEMLKLQDTVSGVHDITQGRRPTGITASRAIQQLQEASQQIIRVKEREVGADPVIDMYKMSLFIIKNMYVDAISIRKVEDGKYQFDTYQPYDIDDDLDFKYVPGSSLPESRASRIDQAIDYLKLGVITPEQFWRWHEKDISSDILEEIVKQKRQAEEQMMADQEIMQTSTDEDEIMNAKLRMSEALGGMPSES